MIRENKNILKYISQNLSEVFITKEFNKGEIILSQNKNVNHISIIQSGLVKCYRSEANGKDFIQEFFGAGEIFGEIEFFTHTVSFCSIEALQELHIYQLPHKDFANLLNSDPQFNQLIMNSLAQKISYKAQRHAFQGSHATENSLMKILNETPDLFNIISKQDMANYLGITLRSLNRILLQLSGKEGLTNEEG
ncbi:Crp/Fnr family transcriptional regulator [Fulvivirga sediminis]|uniref:Crp/Fnr family transcriptional regulator n=1 Tax=Fulvivirga sediminis TaxID=2803949 RepID=A0A937FBQ2_9BACT|nr:Crp/Fnr family transcriptional regulator [Fulvivirga sediminis]MBL3657628.1 Crp/Fnr family transcriptional regulator [Fulvivirga sediminis]